MVVLGPALPSHPIPSCPIPPSPGDISQDLGQAFSQRLSETIPIQAGKGKCPWPMQDRTQPLLAPAAAPLTEALCTAGGGQAPPPR